MRCRSRCRAGSCRRQGVPGFPESRRFQGAIDKGLATGMPLDFAAGSFGDAPRLDQSDSIDLQLVFDGDSAADRFDDAVELALLSALDLLDDNQPFSAAD